MVKRKRIQGHKKPTPASCAPAGTPGLIDLMAHPWMSWQGLAIQTRGCDRPCNLRRIRRARAMGKVRCEVPACDPQRTAATITTIGWK
jgi:hypothetical protein